MIKYTKNDVGCYADGYLGHDYARKVLIDLLHEINDPDAIEKAQELIALVSGDMSDDVDEETAALDLINTELCDRTCYFDFEDGELHLFEMTDWVKEANDFYGAAK